MRFRPHRKWELSQSLLTWSMTRTDQGATGDGPPRRAKFSRVSRHEPSLEHDPRLMHYYEPFAERARILLAGGDTDALERVLDT